MTTTLTTSSTEAEKLETAVADLEKTAVVIEALVAFGMNPLTILTNLPGFLGDVNALVADIKADIAAIKAAV